jgi:ABC-type lipoprotein release transport system permease subunit
LAWRNIFRNKRRTVITGIAIGIGLGSLIFVDALIVGMERSMIRSATASFMGEGQIHAAGFRRTQEVEKTVRNLPAVTAALDREPLVKHYARRALSFGMITSPANVDSIELVGVEPDRERFLSEFDDVLMTGSYFAGTDERDIVIGQKLAESLEVTLGDRVVVTVARAHSGELAQEMFRVSGIYRFNIDELDANLALVRLPRAQEMLGIGASVHEIALQFTDPAFARNAPADFRGRFSAFGNEALGWPQLMPEMKNVLDLADYSVLFTGVILFGIIAFGIINTLFMSLYERMFEFGVLRAVGTRPRRIAGLILCEAGSLAVISIALGMLLALAVVLVFSRTGINYAGVEVAGVTLREKIYPVLLLQQFILYPLWVFAFTLLAGVYPALYAARMSPVEAMRRTL